MQQTEITNTKDNSRNKDKDKKYTERSVLTDDWVEVSKSLTDKIGAYSSIKFYFDHLLSEVLEAHSDYLLGLHKYTQLTEEDKPSGLESELADIVILTMALANLTKCDLQDAINRKIKYLMER